MRDIAFYRRDSEDKMLSIERCYADAENSRLELAFERIRDLDEEFPEDASVLYAHGILLRDHLGSGLEARSLFERAFHAAAPEQKVRGMAAFNVARLARNIDELRTWAATAQQVSQQDDDVKRIFALLTKLNEPGADYHAYLTQRAATVAQSGDLASAAAIREVALAGGRFRAKTEADLRLQRAIWLRGLDAEAERTRKAVLENFPPAERFNLQLALDEVDRAIALDEFVPEQWNSRAAWCLLLGRNEDAIAAADKSIALRPQGYIKPWINKANGLWRSKRYDAAREYARKALDQAQGADDAQDREYAAQMCGFANPDDKGPSDENITEWIKEYMGQASATAQKDIAGRGGPKEFERFATSVFNRTRALAGAWDAMYIELLSQSLSFFSPQLTVFGLMEVGFKNSTVHDHVLCAALYVLVHSEGVMQRDTGRFICLFLLCPLDLAKSRDLYRRLVLETSAADEEFGSLETIVRAELERINPALLKSIADQAPVDSAGRARAKRSVLWRFAPDAMTARRMRRRRGREAVLVAAVLLILGGATYLLWGSVSNMLSLIREYGPQILGVIVICALFAVFAVRRAKYAARQTVCANCDRHFLKVRPPAYAQIPGVLISASALQSGAEGIGRECTACGRTYCSRCEQGPKMQCKCGNRPLPQVRLVYRVR